VDRGLSDIAEILEDGIAKTPGLSADMIEIRRMYAETPKIPCFYGKLVIAFVNILTNAVQAIRKYGTIRIEVSSVRTGRREEDGFVQVRISDTGCGIPTHDLPHVFDPFFTTRTYGEGNGLGLNIVYDIVRIHGGTIQIESVEGEGTTCTVRLPIKLPEKRERPPQNLSRISASFS
jgi:signal transduction histidine kinase